MRITNSMITNNSLLYLNKNMQNTMKLQQQYSTGKKINRPSDDPVVLSRSLKIRTSITEGNQYKRNVSDANSWMNVTEQSFVNTMDMLKRMRDLSVQASSDTNTSDEREKILNEITQLREQMVQEGNVSYAGRYVLSGYKTNVPLMFTEDTKKEIDIEESFKNSDITKKEIIIDGNPPKKKEVYRIRLGYDDINGIKQTDIKGLNFNTKEMNSTDTGSYEPEEGTINYLKDTGEIIINEADVEKMKTTPGFELTTSYYKDSFKKGEPNPVHYFKNYPYNHINDIKIDGNNKIKLQNTPIKEGSVNNMTIDNGVVPTIKYTTSEDTDFVLGSDEIRVDKDTGILTFGSDFTKDDSVKMSYQHISDNIDTDYQIGIDTEKKVPNTDPLSINLGESFIKEDSLNIKFKDATLPTPTIIYKKDLDPAITPFPTDQIRVNTDTGELIFGSDFSDADIASINYEYERKDKNPQKIEYEVSTNQKITVNQLGINVLTNDMLRDIDELISNVTTSVSKIEDIDEQIKNLNENTDLSDEEKEKQISSLKQKRVLQDDMGGKHFSEMIGKSDQHLKIVSKAQAKIGTNINRLDLTTNRLDDDEINFTELLSKTEDVDMAEVIVKIKSQEMIYNASLMATSKVIQQTLLDFIR